MGLWTAGMPEEGKVQEGAPEGAAVVLSGELPTVARSFELHCESVWNMHADFGARSGELSATP